EQAWGIPLEFPRGQACGKRLRRDAVEGCWWLDVHPRAVGSASRIEYHLKRPFERLCLCSDGATHSQDIAGVDRVAALVRRECCSIFRSNGERYNSLRFAQDGLE